MGSFDGGPGSGNIWLKGANLRDARMFSFTKQTLIREKQTLNIG
jgi:hypothetical protein